MKLLFYIVALFSFTLNLNAQSKTWGGSGKTLYPNAAPSTFVIDYGGTNSITVNNTNASGTYIARFQQRGTNVLTIDTAGIIASPTFSLSTDNNVGGFYLLDANAPSVVTQILPYTGNDSDTPYIFDTSNTHTTGNLLEVKNNTTNVFSATFDGAITTGNPGTGAGAWKLGTKVTGVSVALVVTNYVEVNIGGTVVKLAIVQ